MILVLTEVSPDGAALETSLEAPAEEGELRLIGRRHQRDCNSRMHNSERLTKGKARHQLLMHPDDLARLIVEESIAETFVDDPQANTFVERPQRKGFEVVV